MFGNKNFMGNEENYSDSDNFIDWDIGDWHNVCSDQFNCSLFRTTTFLSHSDDGGHCTFRILLCFRSVRKHCGVLSEDRVRSWEDYSSRD